MFIRFTSNFLITEVPGISHLKIDSIPTYIYLGPSYIDFFHGFSQSLQADDKIVLQIRPQPFSSTHFPVYYSLSVLSFNMV